MLLTGDDTSPLMYEVRRQDNDLPSAT